MAALDRIDRADFSLCFLFEFGDRFFFFVRRPCPRMEGKPEPSPAHGGQTTGAAEVSDRPDFHAEYDRERSSSERLVEPV